MSTIAAVFPRHRRPRPWFERTPAHTLRCYARRVGRLGCCYGAACRTRHCVEVCMDTLVNQLARELADAVAAAVADDARVEACREKARAAGLEMRVSLEAVIG